MRRSWVAADMTAMLITGLVGGVVLGPEGVAEADLGRAERMTIPAAWFSPGPGTESEDGHNSGGTLAGDGTWFAPVPLRYERSYVQTVWVYGIEDGDHGRVCVSFMRTRPGRSEEELGRGCMSAAPGFGPVQVLQFRVDAPVNAWHGAYLEADLIRDIGGGDARLFGVTIEYREITD
jgi:hypothetical protein